MTLSPSSGLRRVPDKSKLAAAIPSDLAGASIVLKFHEGTGVGLRAGSLSVEPERIASGAVQKVSRARLDEELLSLTKRLEAEGLTPAPLYRASRAKLDQWKARGEKNIGRPLADLSLYFELSLQGKSRAELSSLLAALNVLESVELAYVQPAPEDARVEPAESVALLSSTPDFVSLQGYVANNAQGIGVSVARGYSGGQGENVRIIDVETRWTANHEDLPTPFYYVPNPTPGDGNHGTAVAGVLAGQDNGFGVTGISPLAGIGYVSHAVGGVATAMTDALDELEPGDVLLLEMHFGGGPNTVTCTCNPGQCNYVPTEYFQAYYDIIETASANGIVVVEAAGNGSVDLDHPDYLGRFDRNVRDSGAVLVGASLSTSRAPTCWTNHGSRVDVHGWGQNVTTASGGDLYDGPLGPEDDYTAIFSGTSSASPIVAGAAALLQSIAIAENDEPLDPFDLRALLVSTGKAQVSDLSRPIGPLPDLATAAPVVGTPTVCGDSVCEGAETCSSCEDDCGVCPSVCGNSVCEVDETCSSCEADCGACPGVCGNSVCEWDETCSSCEDDCGACPPSCVPDGCESAPTVSIPYVVDGATDSCVFFTGSAAYVSSWSMTSVELNGVDVTNTWVSSSSFPATCEGGYYLQALGTVSWAHVEVR